MIIVIIWAGIVVLTYGMSFAALRSDFPSEDEQRWCMGMAILFALFAPLSTLVIFLSTGFAEHGLKWR